MAEFEIIQSEGTQWVRATLKDETIRVEPGALSYMVGDITVRTPRPTMREALNAVVGSETLFRPSYTGSGEVHLESTLGGFKVIELKDEEWILESGSYWASDDAIRIGLKRVRAWTAFWTGEGFVQYQTRVQGIGKVVIHVNGPVEEVELTKSRIQVEGKYVVGWTGDIHYTIRRPTRSYLSYLTAGESYLRSYEGTGRVLVCSTPYWRLRLQQPPLPDAP
jgi:uncharacterized protein (AIM24 family)